MRNAAAVLDINLLVGRLRQVDADGGAAATATAATAAATIAATAATRGRLALLCGAAAVVRRWGAPLLRSDVVAGILNEFDVRANHVAALGLRETRDDGLAESSGNFFLRAITPRPISLGWTTSLNSSSVGRFSMRWASAGDRNALFPRPKSSGVNRCRRADRDSP